ncbi:hypothetical protein C8J56DRAFT_30872 [Mycena floridula]|nr:hypothetical protein C8J56DRAFT_30872 [Mycena floridula]
MNPHTSLLESLDKVASYMTRLDLSSVRVVFFRHLASLQTIMQFMGAQVPDNDVLRALTTKLCNIALSLNMQHLEWPFAAEEEGEILAAITHIESLSTLHQLSASVLVVSDNANEAGPHHARLSTAAHGSSMQINAQDIHLGTVGGSVFSHNTIRLGDPAVRQKVENLMEHVIGEYDISVFCLVNKLSSCGFIDAETSECC